MNRAALVRAAWTAVVYPPVAWLVLVVAIRVRVLLALPASFVEILRWSLFGGFAVAVVLAWHYPKLGHHGAPPSPEG